MRPPHCRDCAADIAAAVEQARNDAREAERAIFHDVWTTNMPLIARREYERGFRDGQAVAEGRATS